MLDDTTRIPRENNDGLLDPESPFAGGFVVNHFRPLIELQIEFDDQHPQPPLTIAELAFEQLKNATKKDFGYDGTRWKNWIETHMN